MKASRTQALSPQHSASDLLNALKEIVVDSEPELLRQQGFVSITELCRVTKQSQQRMRRFILRLEKSGLLEAKTLGREKFFKLKHGVQLCDLKR